MRERGLEVPERGPAVSVAVTNLDTSGHRTVWDGVFSAAQAARGAAIYRQSCVACHFDDLRGDADAPPLAGPEFRTRWIGSDLDNMVSVVTGLMPPDAPGSLDRQAYVDLVAYLLEMNGSPAGDTSLPLDPVLLERIRLTEP
jgi:mono/diheme cytochrome c family protein